MNALALAANLATAALTLPSSVHATSQPALEHLVRAQLAEARMSIRMEIRADLERRSLEYFAAQENPSLEMRFADASPAGR